MTVTAKSNVLLKPQKGQIKHAKKAFKIHSTISHSNYKDRKH